MAFANIDKCGLYQDNCREWSRKRQRDNTWGNFKAHFAWSFNGTRRSSRNAKTEGYAVRVHVAQANAEPFTETQQDHTLALANLATATQADRTLVALLKKTISELLVQVARLAVEIATVHAENVRIKKPGQQSTTAGHGLWASRNSTPSDPNSSQDQDLYF